LVLGTKGDVISGDKKCGRFDDSRASDASNGLDTRLLSKELALGEEKCGCFVDLYISVGSVVEPL
jgi:hypothetical protein